MKTALILLAALSLGAVAQTPKGKRPRTPLPDTVEMRPVTVFSDGTRMAGDLYLPKDKITAARQLLAGGNFISVSLAARPESALYDTVLQPAAAAALDLPIFAPLPTQGRTQYGMGAGELDGHPIRTPADLQSAVAASGANSRIPLRLYRGLTTMTVSAQF